MQTEWPPIEQTHIRIELDGSLYQEALRRRLPLTWLGSRGGAGSGQPLNGPWLEKSLFDDLLRVRNEEQR